MEDTPQKTTRRRGDKPHIVFLISHLRGEEISTRLSDLIRRVLRGQEYGVRISVVDHVLDDALEYARKLEREGEVTVFICARATGYYLRKRLSTPVVLLATGGSEILDAFSKASDYSERVGLMLHRAADEGIERTKHLLKIEVHQRSYLSVLDVPGRIEELVQAGCGVIVGSPMVTEIAQRAGVPAVLLYSEHTIRRALDDALALCQAERAEAARRQRLDTVLRHLTEGVIATDSRGTIESVNAAAGNILGIDRSTAIGKRISSVVPELHALPPLNDGKPDLERVLKLGQHSVVVSRIPLIENHLPNGMITVLQETRVVQRVDRNIRIHSRPRSEVARYRLDHVLGADPAIQTLRALAERYAATGSTILITGESGTGKELLAQGIHSASPRCTESFVAINCAALPETLLESELFGYEEGAFTGARRGGKPGLFEAAHQGTIFLDEVGDMPLLLQTRLLRVLQEREVHRLGALDPTPVDVRVIAATNLDLQEQVAAGKFREDLYYRLNIIRLHMPPLRERLGDLPALAQVLLGRICQRLGRQQPEAEMLQPFLHHLQGYRWPGNIRELENLLERYVASFEGDKPCPPDLLRLILPEHKEAPLPVTASLLKTDRKVRDIELLRQTIAQFGGNYKAAAGHLGISYTTLWRKLKEAQR